MSNVIYLDHQATTPPDPAVVEAVRRSMAEAWGNAASQHAVGRRAAEAVEAARSAVAEGIGAEARAIVFTSGATESINLALRGVALFYAERGRHLVCARTEHAAVLDTLAALEADGFEVTRVDVDAQGRVDPDALAAALREDTTLVSVMHANNEVGTVQDMAAIGARVRAHGAFLHCDAAQSLGKLPIDVDAMPVDLLSMSAHKLYGPQGVGALYCRRRDPRVRLRALHHGGGHERGMRSGSLNVAGIVGFGEACRQAAERMPAERERLDRLAARLFAKIETALGEVVLHGDPTERLPGNLSVGIHGLDATALVAAVPGVAFATGSACTSAVPKPSHVLAAMGVPFALAQGTIRLGVGRYTTEDEVDDAAAQIVAASRALRAGAGADVADGQCPAQLDSPPRPTTLSERSATRTT